MAESNQPQGNVSTGEVAHLIDQMKYRPGLLTVKELRRAAEVVAHTEDAFQGVLRDNRDLAAEIQRLQSVLELIGANGGTKTDEGLVCSGSWCAEQARSALGHL